MRMGCEALSQMFLSLSHFPLPLLSFSISPPCLFLHICPGCNLLTTIWTISLPVAYYYGKRRKISKPPIGESRVESGHPKPARRRKRRKSMFVQKKRRSSAVDLAAGSGEVRLARTLLTVDGEAGPQLHCWCQGRGLMLSGGDREPVPCLTCRTDLTLQRLWQTEVILGPWVGPQGLSPGPSWINLTRRAAQVPGRRGSGGSCRPPPAFSADSAHLPSP